MGFVVRCPQGIQPIAERWQPRGLILRAAWRILSPLTQQPTLSALAGWEHSRPRSIGELNMPVALSQPCGFAEICAVRGRCSSSRWSLHDANHCGLSSLNSQPRCPLGQKREEQVPSSDGGRTSPGDTAASEGVPQRRRQGGRSSPSPSPSPPSTSCVEGGRTPPSRGLCVPLSTSSGARLVFSFRQDSSVTLIALSVSTPVAHPRHQSGH